MISSRGRIVPFQSFLGEANMSLDQSLQETVDRTQQPTLRFYGWTVPTLSLGYFQSFQQRESHGVSASSSCVRRATGGGALMHHHELTYSLIMPQAVGMTGPRLDLYEKTHESLISALLDCGVQVTPFHRSDQTLCGWQCDAFLCFQRRTAHDLVLSGYKVVGSAQRKSKASLLQHGSLLLDASQFAPELPGVNDLVASSVELPELTQAITRRLSEELGVNWIEEDFSNDEKERSEVLVQERFSLDRWLYRR